MHPQAASVLNGLANLYSKQGKYAEAKPLYWRALRIQEQQLGSEHLKVAIVLKGLANLYAAQGKYAQAEPLFQRELAIRKQIFGLDHPLTAETRERLLVVLLALDRTQETVQTEAQRCTGE